MRTTAKQADLARTDAGQQVQIEIGAEYRKLAEARALLEAQTAEQEAEREKLRVLLRRYEEKAALMLTLASPSADALEVRVPAQAIEQAIRQTRGAPGRSRPDAVSLVFCYPLGASRNAAGRAVAPFQSSAEKDGVLKRSAPVRGRGFIGLDGSSPLDDEKIAEYVKRYLAGRLQPGEINPDIWPLIIVRDAGEVEQKLQQVAGAKYSYAEMDRYTDLIGRSLLGVAQTSRLERRGVQPQTIYLNYSQERLASYGLQLSDLSRALNARNITLPGGILRTGTEQVRLDPSGNFEDAQSIGDVVVSRSAVGAPVYLRDLVDISRTYRAPADFLNYYIWVDKDGRSHRDRAITLAVYMRAGEQIQKFGVAVDQRLAVLKTLLPPDLIMVRTSDQPLQVKENVTSSWRRSTRPSRWWCWWRCWASGSGVRRC